MVVKRLGQNEERREERKLPKQGTQFKWEEDEGDENTFWFD